MTEMFKNFMSGYWEFYLSLEKRVEETRQYVEYDIVNHNTYSSNYLMLFQSVCSEIDVVGKEIASFFNPDFEKEKGKKPINRWWYEIQDNLPDINREISFADAYLVKPWDMYRVAKVTHQQNSNGRVIDVTNYNLQDNKVYSTPKWWNAYNKVKHKRLTKDDEGINYKKANLVNLSNSIAALYLLEFEFMKKIGTIEERVKCRESTLFGMGDLGDKYIDGIFVENGVANLFNTRK